MASSQKIEYNCMADVKARLVAAGMSNVITESETQPEAAVFTRVRCLNLRGALPDGKLPTGMRQADMAVECYSYASDDSDGSDLHTATAAARSAIWRDDILTLLNTLSTYHTYYGMTAGDDLPDSDDRYRLNSLQFSLILAPQKN